MSLVDERAPADAGGFLPPFPVRDKSGTAEVDRSFK